MQNGDYIFGKAVTVESGRDYGNALVSKYPIIEYEVISIPNRSFFGRSYGEPRSIIRALVDIDGIKLTVLVSHFGLSQKAQEIAADTVIGIAKDVDTPIIFMGVLNAQPDNICNKMI